MISKAAMLRRIKKRRGNLSAIARDIGCTRQAVSAHVLKDPQLVAACTDARDEIIDIAEKNVYDIVVAGEDVAMLRWFLGCQARDRGYCTRSEEIDAKIKALREMVTTMIAERGGHGDGAEPGVRVVGDVPLPLPVLRPGLS
jgi:hypothetical protein